MDPALAADEAVEDDRLRLIFTCCHPALALAERIPTLPHGGVVEVRALEPAA